MSEGSGLVSFDRSLKHKKSDNSSLHFQLKTLSFCYRLFRYLSIASYKSYCYFSQQNYDLESVAIWGDCVLKKLGNSPFSKPLFHFAPFLNKPCDFLGLTFDSPILFSSFKDDLDILLLWKEMGLGGGISKTIRIQSHQGNQRPRLVELRYKKKPHLLNAMGLPGSGIDCFLKSLELHPLLKKKTPLGISIGGDSSEDYKTLLTKIATWKAEHQHSQLFVELNCSCPNTEKGKTLLSYPEHIKDIIDVAHSLDTELVIGVKVSPDLTNEELEKIFSCLKDSSKTYINTGNTQTKYRDNLGLTAENFHPLKGGLSGASLFERTLEMVKLATSFSMPIIATGGVSNKHQVESLLNNGASLVAVATQLVFDPYQIPLWLVERKSGAPGEN